MVVVSWVKSAEAAMPAHPALQTGRGRPDEGPPSAHPPQGPVAAELPEHGEGEAENTLPVLRSREFVGESGDGNTQPTG